MQPNELCRSVCLLSLIASLPALTFALWPEPPSRSTPSALPPLVPSTVSSHEIEQDFQRFALNALLVPLLDDVEHPPRWADPMQAMACGADSHVEIDGRPLEPGLEMSGRGFLVQWQLDGCLPFGIDGPELTGRAELDVFSEDEGFSAIVRPNQLRARRAGQSTLLNSTFTARTP